MRYLFFMLENEWIEDLKNLDQFLIITMNYWNWQWVNLFKHAIENSCWDSPVWLIGKLNDKHIALLLITNAMVINFLVLTDWRSFSKFSRLFMQSASWSKSWKRDVFILKRSLNSYMSVCRFWTESNLNRFPSGKKNFWCLLSKELKCKKYS